MVVPTEEDKMSAMILELLSGWDAMAGCNSRRGPNELSTSSWNVSINRRPCMTMLGFTGAQ
jgi:hypothetical protein